MSTKRVYLSGPITGLTYQDARFGWRKDFEKQTSWHIVSLSPMRHEGHLAEIKGPLANEYPKSLFSHPKMIVAKDFLDIRMSDIVVVYLLGAAKVSIGTMVEIGYAKALGKTIVTIMEPENLHTHPFVTEVSDVVCASVDEAATIVNSLLSEGI